MKNAPTTGTTRKLRGAGPKRSTRACMFAIAFGVIPIQILCERIVTFAAQYYFIYA
jgi:hypothetical protein